MGIGIGCMLGQYVRTELKKNKNEQQPRKGYPIIPAWLSIPINLKIT